MYNIRSFHPKLDYLDALHRWTDELEIDHNIVSKLELRLLLNEGFINSLEAALSDHDQVVVMVKKRDDADGIEIIISDNGTGFSLNEQQGNFDDQMMGKAFLVSAHANIELHAVPIKPNVLKFETMKVLDPTRELLDRHRGILAILKIADEVQYVYAANSYNYLRVLISKKNNNE